MIKLSQQLNGIFLILRFKNLDHWVTNSYFKSILEKLNNCENIIISKNFTPFHAYRLCAHADLVIAKHTSIADECLSKEIPVLFHEYTHNLEKILLDIPNYIPSQLICHNFEDLYQKSKSILFSNKFDEEIKQLNEKIYYVNEKKNIKKTILKNLENQLIQNKP